MKNTLTTTVKFLMLGALFAAIGTVLYVLLGGQALAGIYNNIVSNSDSVLTGTLPDLSVIGEQFTWNLSDSDHNDEYGIDRIKLSYDDKQRIIIEEYYDDSVFIGDSMLLGFSNYLSYSGTDEHITARFLTSQDFTLEQALYGTDPVRQPLCLGQPRYVWESVKLLEPERVFICFGAQDIAMNGAQGTIDNCKLLAEKLHEAAPDCELYFVSACYIYSGAEGGELTNAAVARYNRLLMEYAAGQEKVSYVNIASYLGSATKGVYTLYSSDRYIHLTKTAYRVWTRVFMDYALGVRTNAHELPEPGWTEWK